MGEIKSSDIIEDAALQVPLILAKNLEVPLDVIKKILASAREYNTVLGSTESTRKVSEATKALTLEQQQLYKVQNQIATTVAKNNEVYREHERELQKVKQSLKEKIALGERDSLTINRQNASMKELEAALNKNRVAWSKLRTEEERASKSGKDLLKVIQQQDKEFKSLKVSMGQHQDNVGNYQSALQGLDGTMGGVIGRAKMMGQQFKAIFSNGYVLLLAAVVGLFIALKSAVSAYYDRTVEGEERAKQQEAVWDAFFITLKSGWADVGKAVDELFGENGLKATLTAFLAYFDMSFGTNLVAKFLATEAKTKKLADAMAKLWKDHTQDVVDDSVTELKANEQLEISRDKLNKTAEQRLAALSEYKRLRTEQLTGDVQLAKDDLRAQELRIESLGGVLKSEKLISEMTHEEIIAIGVKQEEIEKLGQLQAAVYKVESDASEKRTGLLKLEKSLNDEIFKEKTEQIQKLIEAELLRTKNEEADISKRAKDKAVKKLSDPNLSEAQRRKIISDTDKQIEIDKKEGARRVIQDEILVLQEHLGLLAFNEEETKKINQRIAELQVGLTNAIYDNIHETNETILEKTEKTVQKLQQIFSDFSRSIGALLNSFTERRLQEIELESRAEDDRLNSKLEKEKRVEEELLRNKKLTEDQKDAIKAVSAKNQQKIEEESAKRQEALEKQRLKAQQRAAIFDKASSLIQAGINTALAVTNQLGKGDPYTAFARAVLAGALGAIQVAAIAAKPIPKYEIGTDNHPGGLAIVGEKGSELVTTPSGKNILTPSVPTLMNLPKGTEVLNHKETLQRLALSSLMHVERSDRKDNSKDFDDIKKELKTITSTIKNKREVSVNGNIIGYMSGGTRVKYLDSLRNRS